MGLLRVYVVYLIKYYSLLAKLTHVRHSEIDLFLLVTGGKRVFGTVLYMNALAIRDIWLEELSIRGASSNTISIFKRNTDEALVHMSKFYGVSVRDLALEAIGRDAVVASLATYRSRVDGRSGKVVDRSASSTKSFYTALTAYFNWCVLTDRLVNNPIVSIKPPKVGGRVPKALSFESCGKLMTVAKSSKNPERDTLAVSLALMMGFRLSELAGIKLSQFSPSLNGATHLVTRGKGDKERSVPVPNAVRSALSAYLPLRERSLLRYGVASDVLLLSSRVNAGSLSITPDGLGQVFDSLVKKAGIKAPGIRTHMARHSFATHLLSSGSSDLMEVKELLGHSSVATTQIYLKVDPERLSKGVESNPITLL